MARIGISVREMAASCSAAKYRSVNTISNGIV